MQNPDTIRQLLEKYYSGTASQTEISDLHNYFMSGNDVHPDFHADQRIFDAIAKAGNAIAEAPADLSKRLAQISRSDTPGTAKILRLILSGAVAAAVIILMVIYFRPQTNNAGSEGQFLAVTVPVEPPVAEIVPKTDSVTIPVETPPPAKKMPIRRAKQSKAANKAAPAKDVEIERTSLSEKELRGLQLASKCFERSFDKAELACASVDESFQIIDNSLNRLSK